jgi:hypothetical protein
MGYPDKSTPKPDADFQSRLTTSFGRLKAATGLARSPQPEPAQTPAPQAPPAPLVLSAQDMVDTPPLTHAGPSILSAKVELNGTLNAPTALHVYGAVKGDVRAADLAVFPGGSIKGDVIAESVVVHGSIEGDIQAKKVQLCSGALRRPSRVYRSAATIPPTSNRLHPSATGQRQPPRRAPDATPRRRNSPSEQHGRSARPASGSRPCSSPDRRRIHWGCSRR